MAGEEEGFKESRVLGRFKVVWCEWGCGGVVFGADNASNRADFTGTNMGKIEGWACKVFTGCSWEVSGICTCDNFLELFFSDFWHRGVFVNYPSKEIYIVGRVWIYGESK